MNMSDISSLERIIASLSSQIREDNMRVMDELKNIRITGGIVDSRLSRAEEKIAVLESEKRRNEELIAELRTAQVVSETASKTRAEVTDKHFKIVVAAGTMFAMAMSGLGWYLINKPTIQLNDKTAKVAPGKPAGTP